ncbi:MAG: hypothetical protein IJZ47_04760 [Oscillospiraceae bacterium]|nr:hypothetical protein [Oscillospiraceae bacterium]
MRKEYNRLFDKITSSMSDKELLEAALRKAENMKSEKKTINIRKPIVIACAAVAVLACGATAAAVTGLLDFDTLFGNRIVAENEQLGYELIGDARDVVITCSDNNYNVSLNGVTGNANSIIASVEISRKDGGSMRELARSHDISMPDIRDVKLTYNNDGMEPKPLQLGYSGEYTETDSVAYTMKISMQRDDFSSEDVLSGKRISMSLDDYGFTPDSDGFDIQIEFTYVPSEKSLEQLTAADVSAPCEILYNISAFSETETELPTGRDIPLETIITAIDIRPNEGMLHGSFSFVEGYNWEDYTVSTFMCNNDVKLIRNDGTDIPVFLSGYNMVRDGSSVTFVMDLEYRPMTDPTETAVDLSTVTALSINSTEYPLA